MNEMVEKPSFATVSLICKTFGGFPVTFGFFSKVFFFKSNHEFISKNWTFLMFCIVFFRHYEYCGYVFEQTSLLSEENRTMRLPPLWGFQGSSLLFLPTPEQWNVLCLHPLLSSKRSVAADDSEEAVLAQARRKEYFPTSAGVFWVLCLFSGVF